MTVYFVQGKPPVGILSSCLESLRFEHGAKPVILFDTPLPDLMHKLNSHRYAKSAQHAMITRQDRYRMTNGTGHMLQYTFLSTLLLSGREI